eukprot:TRINITY_DN955_c0_g1_i12.p1 TRINITY_DN955_c0_g1~~TRINITY_DN955_c0_g1_i12.p1  ORF type:complete len:408 (+),score=128.74 TRINITY_DN955_c0_g1_i12:173-1396(+)
MRIGIFISLLAVVAEGAFPRNFSFGAATSALQIEGAWLADNRTLAVWDNLARVKRYVKDHSNTEHTCNSYYMYHQDIALMKEYGIKHYRMSIQWSRVLPLARNGTNVNMKAVEYYRGVLTALREAGIEPYVNLYHNDMPAVLFVEGNGRMDPEFPMHFRYYADVCFQYFGELVKYWFTFDEPWCQSAQGLYEAHERNTKPYMIGYQMILAHAEAVDVYRQKYEEQQGKIGINLNIEMFWPNNTASAADKEAARRNLMFQVGWFWNPIMTGDYPEVMKSIVKTRLPAFSDEQKKKVKGSADFLALNHYFSWVTSDGYNRSVNTYNADVNATNGRKPEWKRSNIGFSIVPEGMYDALKFVHETWMKDSSIPIFITENGVSIEEKEREKGLNDTETVSYTHLTLPTICSV